MNLISNTCIGAYLYKLLNLKFENPFCWSVIDFNSMYYLIKNYEKIKLCKMKKYKLIIANNNIDLKKNFQSLFL